MTFRPQLSYIELSQWLNSVSSNDLAICACSFLKEDAYNCKKYDFAPYEGFDDRTYIDYIATIIKTVRKRVLLRASQRNNNNNNNNNDRLVLTDTKLIEGMTNFIPKSKLITLCWYVLGLHFGTFAQNATEYLTRVESVMDHWDALSRVIIPLLKQMVTTYNYVVGHFRKGIFGGRDSILTSSTTTPEYNYALIHNLSNSIVRTAQILNSHNNPLIMQQLHPIRQQPIDMGTHVVEDYINWLKENTEPVTGESEQEEFENTIRTSIQSLYRNRIEDNNNNNNNSSSSSSSSFETTQYIQAEYEDGDDDDDDEQQLQEEAFQIRNNQLNNQLAK
jgi:hypothetical protein